MPANLTPEYKAAEAGYRRARDPQERLGWLQEMLRTLPKHKGTDHLRADIKTRLKELREELAGPKKGGTRRGPLVTIRVEGAAQVSLLGPSNTGKSTLHARLTGSHAQTGPFPFTTQMPQPGMLPYQDVSFQLIDLPPLSPGHPVPWIANALQPADGALLVVDLSEPGCVEQIQATHEMLAERRVTLIDTWPPRGAPSEERADDDIFTVRLPTLMIANKADEIPGLSEELKVFQELTGFRYPVITTSATTGEGINEIGPWLFDHLGIVRAYTKVPGKPADHGRPYTLRWGQTVEDLAVLVHKEIGQSLRYARVWGEATFDGQQVGREHPLADGDIVELHT